MVNAISTLVGPSIEGAYKWRASVTGSDNCIYGIPYKARRVVKFDPIDKSLTEIGPDLGDRRAWYSGVLANNGCIYCLPVFSHWNTLKINTADGTVTILDIRLPENGSWLWISGALGLDGCIYYMPADARRILKLNPEDNSLLLVGDLLLGLGIGKKFWETVVDQEGYVYGIPYDANRIIKYNPRGGPIAFVGEAFDEYPKLQSGAFGRDGCIYANSVDNKCILKIDLTENMHAVVCTTDFNINGKLVLGIDGCLYLPPSRERGKVARFDTETNVISEVGDDFAVHGTVPWDSGALAPDGAIYCIPSHANHVLAIDPLKELTDILQNNMERHPMQLGLLFQQIDSTRTGETLYDTSFRRFGRDVAFRTFVKVLEDSGDLLNEVCETKNLHLCMIAASLGNSALSIIYHLLKRDPPHYCIEF